MRQEDWGANQPLGSQLALSHQLLPESFPLVCVIPIPPPGGELQPFNLPLSPLLPEGAGKRLFVCVCVRERER